MSDLQQKTVIIGAGQAGLQAAASLRQWGYEGAILMIGDEPYLPYQRPPLSKGYLKGALDRSRLYLKPDAWFAEYNVDIIMDRRVEEINRATKSLTLSDGSVEPYGALIIATGSRPRVPSIDGARLEGVFTLRSLTDIDAMKIYMAQKRRIVIVGGGYIGLEAAAAARELGHDVCVVEMADRVLERVAGAQISSFFEDEHKAQGVDVITRAALNAIVDKNGQVNAVVLDNGATLSADMVLIGIGIIPNIELAEAAGLVCELGGVLVNRDARTSDPAIFAIGDCATRPLVHYDYEARLESVHNAIEQGKLAAAAITGKPRPPEDCPWFWSDQYDLKLQIAGVSRNHDATILRGDPAERRFAVFYLQDRRLIAVDAVNSPPEFLIGKKLVAAKAEPDPIQLADPSVSMKQIAVG